MEDIVFEVIDKLGAIVHLSKERWKHIQKHPFMHNCLEDIQFALRKPLTIRYEDDESVLYFYKEYKENAPTERYLLVGVKYLNNKGFIITSFFTNKITGLKWKAK